MDNATNYRAGNSRIIREKTMAAGYDATYSAWQKDPQAFWAEAAQDIHWFKTWDQVLDDSRAPFYRWFPGAQTNTCYNAVDRHVEAGRGGQAAIIYDSPVTDTIRTISYAELQSQTAQCAGMLRALGVEKGDRVLIYMPAVPEAVIGMLACARINHLTIFGLFEPLLPATGFAPGVVTDVGGQMVDYLL